MEVCDRKRAGAVGIGYRRRSRERTRHFIKLISINGPITPATIEETATELELDVERLKSDMNSPENRERWILAGSRS